MAGIDRIQYMLDKRNVKEVIFRMEDNNQNEDRGMEDTYYNHTHSQEEPNVDAKIEKDNHENQYNYGQGQQNYYEQDGQYRQYGQNSYQQYNQYSQNTSGNGFGIASMILGILALVLFCTCINIPMAIAAVIFGILQLARGPEGKGTAIVGIVTAALSVIALIVAIALAWGPFMAYYQQSVSQGNPGHLYDYDDYDDDYDDYFDHLPFEFDYDHYQLPDSGSQKRMNKGATEL